MSRYIDADRLQQTYKEIHGGKRSLLIDTEPTADVRENVKGEWISTGFMEVTCSNCKETFHELESANFCPNCGADMRPITALSKNAEIDLNLKKR